MVSSSALVGSMHFFKSSNDSASIVKRLVREINENLNSPCNMASTHPRLVAKFNEDLEHLLGESKRLIGTLSIVTLLKTQNQDSVDRLLKYISTFLTFIADEYKVMVFRSLQQVYTLSPQKYLAILPDSPKSYAKRADSDSKPPSSHPPFPP